MNKRYGFSLLEAILSFWIMAIVCMSVMLINTALNTKGNQYKLQAMNVARSEMECCIGALRGGRPMYNSNFDVHSGNSFVLSRPSKSNDWKYSYTRSVFLGDQYFQASDVRKGDMTNSLKNGGDEFIVFVEAEMINANEYMSSDDGLAKYNVRVEVRWSDVALGKRTGAPDEGDGRARRFVTLSLQVYDRSIPKNVLMQEGGTP